MPSPDQGQEAEVEPKETTRTGVEIPIPERDDFLRDLRKVASPATPATDEGTEP